jgi:hypothetical protein
MAKLTITPKAKEVEVKDVIKVIKGTNKFGKPYTMIVIDQEYRFNEDVATWLSQELGLETFESKK